MTHQTNHNRSASTETTSEDSDSPTPLPERPHEWDESQPEQDKPDATPISDPPDRGVDYYNRLIDLDSCHYTYIKNGSHLGFRWQGELRDMDDFSAALYELYLSAYNSDLSAADLRPKAFQTFVGETVSKHLEYTLQQRNPIEGPPGPRNQSRDKINERIAQIVHEAAALACEHRAQLGRRAQSKDKVLKSILPEHVHDQSV